MRAGRLAVQFSCSYLHLAHILTIELDRELRADGIIHFAADMLGVVAFQDFRRLLHRTVDIGRPSPLVPFIRAPAVADGRVDIITLHQMQRLIGA